jgi:predicted metal-binding membrane protein
MVERQPPRAGGLSRMLDSTQGAEPQQGQRRFRLSRDSGVVIGSMIVLSALAWVYLVWMPVDGMARGILARSDGSMDGMQMDGMQMDSPSMSMPSDLMDVSGWAASLPLFVVMWVVMMVAMMFPAVSPVVLLFDRWRRGRQRSVATTIAFVAGYLIIWSVAGVFAFAAIVALDLQIENSSTAVRVGGAVLVVAGLYQLTPLKTVCLTQCRSPLSLIMEHAQLLGEGVRGPLQVGLMHGGWCIGCCWALMAVLIALGVMHLGWMAAVAAVILAEKVLPGGPTTSRVIGGVLLVAGAAVAVTA